MKPLWWQSGAIYQIYPRSFADSNGDGLGDLGGITAHLGYLAETLGVDAIWLSPFYPSPQADFGYDVSDYCDVDPTYGALEDFDRLATEAHRLGLKLIIDFVPNHSSDRHPWFVESRQNRTNPKRDWYTWRDPKPDGSPPNNWVSVFGGPAWTVDERTGQYYLHSFLAEQPDLNWRNPEVEEAMLAALRFWLDRGVDGFRIDVAHFLMKDPQLRDNPVRSRLPKDGYKVQSDYSLQNHVHDIGHPDIHPLYRRIRLLLDSYPERYSVGEIHEWDWGKWASYFGDNDELHMPFNFALLPAGVDAGKVRAAISGLEAALPKGAWPNWVLGNHDEPRISTRLGWEQSKVAALMLLTLRGTPTIYYGDEIGMEELDIPAERQADPWGRRRPGLGRDGCRTPMQWTAETNAGFSKPGCVTWLPIHPRHPERNVASELGDASSHLELYRRLLRLRKSRPSLSIGNIELVDSPPETLMYRRGAGSSDAVVVTLNLSDRPAEVGDLSGTILAGTRPERNGDPFSGHLAPWEGVVLT